MRYIIDGKEFGLLSAVSYLMKFLPEEERCDEEEYIIEDLLCYGEDMICGKEIERRTEK